MRRVKILVDAHVFDGGYQGTRTFIKGIYSELLKKLNFDFYFAAADIENLKNEFGVAENIFFIKLKSNSGFARLLFEFPQLINKYKIDFAHFQYIAPIQKKCKFIVTTHDLLFNEFPQEFTKAYRIKKNLFFKFSAKRADILTTVSAYSKDSIKRHFGILDKEIFILPNGVSPVYFQEHDKALSKNFIKTKYGIDKFILYVSRFEPRKNHEVLLRAFLHLKLHQKNIHLVLLGKESIKNSLFSKMIADLSPDIRKYIFTTDAVNDNDLLKFYRATLVFVYPSKAEVFGIPPLEAAAAKTPVLCSNSSAMSAFDFFGEDHIDPENFELLTERLHHLIDQPPGDLYLNKLSEIVKEKYNWEFGTEKLYDAIIAQSQST